MQAKKMISMSYELWQHHKLPKTIEMGEVLTMRDIYIISNLNPLTKSTSSSRSTEFRYSPIELLSIDHEDHSNQREYSHKLCDETSIQF